MCKSTIHSIQMYKKYYAQQHLPVNITKTRTRTLLKVGLNFKSTNLTAVTFLVMVRLLSKN